MMGLGLIIPTSPSFFHGFVNHDVLSPALCGFLKEPYNSEHVLLPSGYVKIAIENGHRNLIYPLEMMIFHGFLYVYQRVHWKQDLLLTKTRNCRFTSKRFTFSRCRGTPHFRVIRVT